jgi:hypothetical protein
MTPLELLLLGALIGVVGCVLYGDIRRRLRMAPPTKTDPLVITITADTKQFDEEIAKSIALAENLAIITEKLVSKKAAL